jgi:hypothetical protein
MGNENKYFSDYSLAKLLKDHIPDSFDNNFSIRVMSQIRSFEYALSDFELFVESLTNLFKRFAIIGSLVILFLISYNIFSKGEVTLAKALDIPDYTIVDAFDPLNSYQWSKE